MPDLLEAPKPLQYLAATLEEDLAGAPGTVVHSDRGSTYTSWVFGHRLRQAGLLGSMGRVASSVDNALIESFWSTMQRELLDRQH